VTSVALCFPGQGSQAAGMADRLAELPIAQEMLSAAEACGLDLAAALTGDDEQLRPTDIAQPALLFVECALRSTLPADLDVVAVAGHSVGEYAAAVAAHAITPADAMRLVIERGRAMAAMREGTMSALLSLDLETATAVCAEAQRDTGEIVIVANHNAPGQLVISGSQRGVEAAAQLAIARGARRVIPLNVSGAFHSPLMTDAASLFGVALDSVALFDPQPPVVCNVDARAVHTAGVLRERLREQLTAPVRWIECVERLVELGAETLIEVGPGSVLSGLARRIAPGVRAVAVNTPDAAARLDLAMVAG
jgi:[acyl-carrier-protein] S-malonyltransferase